MRIRSEQKGFSPLCESTLVIARGAAALRDSGLNCKPCFAPVVEASSSSSSSGSCTGDCLYLSVDNGVFDPPPDCTAECSITPGFFDGTWEYQSNDCSVGCGCDESDPITCDFYCVYGYGHIDDTISVPCG